MANANIGCYLEHIRQEQRRNIFFVPGLSIIAPGILFTRLMCVLWGVLGKIRGSSENKEND